MAQLQVQRILLSRLNAGHVLVFRRSTTGLSHINKTQNNPPPTLQAARFPASDHFFGW